MRPVAVIAVSLLIAACGGGTGPTLAPSSGPTSAPTAGQTAAPTGATGAEALCVLKPEDWQQFNYVTGASPDVTSESEGTAICQYASGLFLEMYTHANEADAQATYQTMLANIPMPAPEELELPGADQVAFDADIGDNHAGIAVRAGNLDFLITGLNRDTVRAELLTLAALVLARSADLQ